MLYCIKKSLGNDLFLVRVAMTVDEREAAWKLWRICKFVYVEGIGGRQILDTENMDFGIVFHSEPSDEEVKHAVSKNSFIRRPIEVLK